MILNEIITLTKVSDGAPGSGAAFYIDSNAKEILKYKEVVDGKKITKLSPQTFAFSLKSPQGEKGNISQERIECKVQIKF
jgi:hypothetical protein